MSLGRNVKPLAFGLAALGSCRRAAGFGRRQVVHAQDRRRPGDEALEPIFMANKHFVPTVKARVEKETDHKIRFIEAYGGTVAGPFDVLESVEKGVFDIGLWCACFEPTKAVHFASTTSCPSSPTTRCCRTRSRARPTSSSRNGPSRCTSLTRSGSAPARFSSYGLGTKFKWSKMADLKGHKIAGAGPNLPWLKLSGATAVQTSLNEAYNSLQSGVYEGLVIFPTAWLGFKLNEPAKVFTVVGWGSTSLYQMTMNLDSYNKLPPAVRKIIDEESEIWMDKSAQESSKRFDASLKKLKETGSTIQYLPFEGARQDGRGARRLAEAERQEVRRPGLPGTALMKAYLKNAEAAGIKLPHKYDLD